MMKISIIMIKKEIRYVEDQKGIRKRDTGLKG